MPLRFLLCLLYLTPCLTLPAAAKPPVKAIAPHSIPAVNAIDFLNSLGVCTHMAQGIDNPSQSAVCLKFAGIQNIRDDGSLTHVPDWITVYQQSGARLCLLTNQNIPETLDMAKQLKAAGALLAVEGPNEPNNAPVTFKGQKSGYNTTALPIAQFQAALYKAVKAEPSLSGIPVFHSSEAGGSEKDNAGLQFLTIPTGAGTLMPDGTQFADFANTHNYVCGHKNAVIDNVGWNATDLTLNGDWDGMVGEYGHTWHGGFSGYSNEQLLRLPKVCTETGWTTRGSGSVTEEQQARILLNLFFDGYKQGWKYTFIYMLRDDPIQGYWGLFDTNYAPKTSGKYLHNLSTVLADKGTPVKPGRLNYSIVNQPATVHDLLLQKSNGTFEMAVWDEQVSGTSRVAVRFGAKQAAVKVYDPTLGTVPVQALKQVKSISLTLSDHPVILEIPRSGK
ncbi:MAG: hypothetical protein ACRYFS_08930 [Janthinobacterium lividum]